MDDLQQDPRHTRRPKTYYRVSDGRLALDVSIVGGVARFYREGSEMKKQKSTAFLKTHREVQP
jgi:hypothetical protein